MPHDAQGKSTLSFEAGQAGGGIKHGVQVIALRQVAVFGGDASGNLLKLVAARKIMVEHEKCFSNSAGICTIGERTMTNVRLDFPVLICFASAWTISGEEKAMEVREHENCRAIRRSHGVD